jgi:hypothetical protein
LSAITALAFCALHMVVADVDRGTRSAVARRLRAATMIRDIYEREAAARGLALVMMAMTLAPAI